MNYEEKTVSCEKVYKGSIIDVERLKVELPDGSCSNRDIVRHQGASVILPVDNDNGIYVVRQYRKAIERISLELPAGKVDEGEKPEECAVRELKEETGLTAQSIKLMFRIHSTPGFSDEVLYLFYAEGLTKGDLNLDKDEFLSCEKYHLDKLIKMVYDGYITDAKTIIGVLAASHKRLN